MYSIPVYALRFAAHCRSRLKYLDRADGSARSVSPARAWLRLATHDARARVPAACDNRRRSELS